MKISAEEYPAYKGFFGWIWTHRLLSQFDEPAPESSPILALEALEAKSAALARRGLTMGLGDTLEMLVDLSTVDVAHIDAALTSAGWPSLSAVRTRFDRSIASILKHGRVRNEREYYALRNIVDDLPDGERREAWALLGGFEASRAHRAVK